MPRRPLLACGPGPSNESLPTGKTGRDPSIQLQNSPSGRLSSAWLQITDLLDSTLPSANGGGQERAEDTKNTKAADGAEQTAEAPQPLDVPVPHGLAGHKETESTVASRQASAGPTRAPSRSLISVSTAPAKSLPTLSGVATQGDGADDQNKGAESCGAGSCYKVAFTRMAHKKRRTWECGIMRISESKARLYSEEGKELPLGKTLRTKEALTSGTELKAGNFLIEVEADIPVDDFLSGRAFAAPQANEPLAALAPEQKKRRVRSLFGGPSDKVNEPQPEPVVKAPPPSAPSGALVLGGSADGQQLFLEPALSAKLRPHQKDGILFMFRHLLAGGGCILADSMGLGKTLQALCVLWVALSKPSGQPISRKAAVVCPSSLCMNWEAEVNHWLGPLRVRPLVIQGGSYAAISISQLKTFLSTGGPASSEGRLLIISYDQLRSYAEMLSEAVDLLVFDEGHRLKSSSATTTQRISSMQCQRRILLTGTPLQNSLEEFWCCCCFVQPKLLPPLGTFQRVFKRPIERAQDSSASRQEVALGTSRSAELTRLTSPIILRRGPEILEALLPSRTELLLTVALTPPQVIVYQALCGLHVSGKLEAQHLHLLVLLRQLCNTPEDLRLHCHKVSEANASTSATAKEDCRDGPDDLSDCEAGSDLNPHRASMPSQFMQSCRSAFARVPAHVWASEEKPPKLCLLESILRHLRDTAPDDGIVIVSNFVATLTRCEELCTSLGFATTLLMGTTQVRKRVGLVQEFNQTRGKRVFLLSSRAGGVGLNIVGANRLIMLEPDWNPAQDLQAMGRVWRQGQTKPVFIYRMATYGTLEEKILQRQERKQGLATVMVESAHADGMQVGDWEDLRRVYSLEGYSLSGHLLTSEEPVFEPRDIFEEAGVTAQSVRELLLGATVLATTRREGAEAKPDGVPPTSTDQSAPDPVLAAADSGKGEATDQCPTNHSRSKSDSKAGRWDHFLP